MEDWEEQIELVAEWTAAELFHYLKNNYIIAEDEEFDNWMHSRWDMIRMVRNHMNE